MIGSVDLVGRALLTVSVGASPESKGVSLDVWVDTGFTGDLVLPQQSISATGLPHSGSVDAILADGSRIELTTYPCFIKWFGETRRLEVVANDGDFPLLGVGLLMDLELQVNYRTSELALDQP